MNFHWPSFLLGVATGAAGSAMWDRLRPVFAELLAAGSSLTDTVATRVATWQEDAEDEVAAARNRRRLAKVRPIRRPARRRRAAR